MDVLIQTCSSNVLVQQSNTEASDKHAVCVCKAVRDETGCNTTLLLGSEDEGKTQECHG